MNAISIFSFWMMLKCTTVVSCKPHELFCSIIFDLKCPPIKLCSPSLARYHRTPFPTCNSAESHGNNNSDGEPMGLPVGANAKKMSTWEPMLDKLRVRLNSWGNKYASLGGRIVLLNSVLNSISIFYLSFFNIPAKVLKQIVRIQREFLWGIDRGEGGKYVGLVGGVFTNQSVKVALVLKILSWWILAFLKNGDGICSRRILLFGKLSFLRNMGVVLVIWWSRETIIGLVFVLLGGKMCCP